MISRILFADELVCISPEHCMEVCGSEAGCSNVAYPRLVMSVMPPGLRGLMMAVMIAALMSDLDSIFNSASTIFTLDIYKMLRKQVSSRELVVVGRLFVVFMVIISIAWVPVIIEMQGGQMFYYIQEVSDYLTPPIAALFLLGILWHRCNETGAFCGGMVGFVLGALRLIMAFVYREPHCDQPDERPAFIKNVHFMYVASILFWVTGLVAVVVSLCTPPPEKELVRTTTLWGLKQRKILKQQGKERDGNINSLKLLNYSSLSENTLLCKEESNNQSNKWNVHNGHAIIDTQTETQLPMQYGCQLIQVADPLTEGGEEREARDGEEEEEWCFGGGGMEGGKCVRFLECLCGLQEKPSKSQVPSTQEYVDVDALLYEAPRTRMILNTGLLLICSIGVFLFIHFSL